jgi:hypothetical protein
MSFNLQSSFFLLIQSESPNPLMNLFLLEWNVNRLLLSIIDLILFRILYCVIYKLRVIILVISPIIPSRCRLNPHFLWLIFSLLLYPLIRSAFVGVRSSVIKVCVGWIGVLLSRVYLTWWYSSVIIIQWSELKWGIHWWLTPSCISINKISNKTGKTCHFLIGKING